jgi:ubiquitin carboxyl-terminal hydrolase 22/27/51
LVVCLFVYLGGIDTGHYICYTRSGCSWYKFDDRCVTRVKKSEVLNVSAYLLFYMRAKLK